MKIKYLTMCLLALAIFSSPLFAAGVVELAEGTVTVINAKGESRTPKKGDTVAEGDTLVTGRNGELHVRLDDNGLIALRANTRLKIENYRAQGDSDDKAFFSLLKGTFRSITGWIGKYNANNYGIKTPTATIGVRGTDHEPLVVTEPEPGEVVTVPPGTYDKVNSGITTLGNKFGVTLLNPNQAGFAPKDAAAAPKPLPKVPEIFKPTKHETEIDKTKGLLNKNIDLRLKERQDDLIKKRGTEGQPDKKLPPLLGDIKARELVPAVTPAIKGSDIGVKTLPTGQLTTPQIVEPGKLPILTPPAAISPTITPTTTLPGTISPTLTRTPTLSPTITPTFSAPASTTVIKTSPLTAPATTRTLIK
jgi:hypothetical protein